MSAAAALRWPRRPLVLLVALLGALPALYVLLDFVGWLWLPYVRFQHPWLTLPAGALVIWVARRQLLLSTQLSTVRRTLIELWSGAAALAAAFSACGLEIGLPLDRLTVVVAVDRSRSIDLVPNAASRLESERVAAEVSMRPDDRIAIVAFGATAVVEDPARPKTRLPSPQQAEVARDGTDIAAAIQKSLTAIPPDSSARIVLLSDGVATRGDAIRAALSATALGVPIDTVVLDQGHVPSVRVAHVRLASSAAQGEALFLKVATQATQEAGVEVRVYRNGELVRKGPTRIAQGEDLIVLRELAHGPGLHRYDVEISALDANQDRSPEDNVGAAFVRVRGPSSALVLEDPPELARAVGDALRGAGFQVTVSGPTGIPSDVAAFGRYDLIVLGAISASELSPSQLEGLASYVRDLGGGLLLLGGDRSLGPGGYARTPLEEVSPVSFDLKQERRRASLAEIIAVDYSGSMAMRAGNRTKLELANEAAIRSAELLGTGDRLGVLHVDTELSWTVPLGPIVDKEALAARVRRVQPGGGGIFIDLTLSAAYAALEREEVQLKHVLLFSDGSDAEERSQAFRLVSGARGRGITTSVVALGDGSDVPALARMAELGGGRFYLIHDATRLPAVFAQETILASRSAINEVDFVPRAAAQSAILRGIDFSQAPTLTGYVVTLPKSRAEIHLEGPEGDPLLATWAAGLGRSAVFTSDYRDRWGLGWTSWEGAATLFGQLGRDLARRGDDPRVRLTADAIGGELTLEAVVRDDRGQHETLRRLRVRIAGPDGQGREAHLEAVGAGSYRTKLALERPGAYVATLVDEDSGLTLATTGAVLSTGEELRPTGSDRALLRRISELTAGQFRTTLAGIFADREARRFGYTNVSSWLLAVAAGSMLLAAASRRLILPQLPAVLKRNREPLPVPDPQGSPSAEPATLTALQRRKRQHAARETLIAPSAEHDPVIRREAPRTPAAPSAGQTAPPLNPEQPKSRSAAEILLERRRARGGR